MSRLIAVNLRLPKELLYDCRQIAIDEGISFATWYDE